MSLMMSSEDYARETDEGGYGYCKACHREHEGYVDPDGREIACENCGEIPCMVLKNC